MTTTMHPSQIQQDRLEQLRRDGPAQARRQELQGACMGLLAFLMLFLWSVSTQ